MKPESASVSTYIDNLPEVAASFAANIRRAVFDNAPLATEQIKYGMPVFHLNGQYIFYVGAWKNHVGIYPIYRGYDFENEIAHYRSGKDTVKFLFKNELPLPLIVKIIRARINVLLP